MYKKKLIIKLLGIFFFISPEFTFASEKEIDQLSNTRECNSCNLERLNLSGKDLSFSSLDNSNLSKANISKANLNETSLKALI